MTRSHRIYIGGVCLLATFAISLCFTLRAQEPRVADVPNLAQQSPAEAFRKSQGCVVCHQNSHDPHGSKAIHLGCVDCHGGDPCATTKERAHPAARFPEAWKSSANPVRSYALLNHESPDFVRFVNPGDLRIASISCGNAGCHAKEVLENKTGMMTHGCMLWGAALYNNGSVPLKQARYGESYSMNGVPQRMQTVPPPTDYEIKKKGVVPYLDPNIRYEASQPGNILRIFERGGRFRPEVGIPERDEESGRPRTRLSERGLGTENRTDPVWVSPGPHSPVRSERSTSSAPTITRATIAPAVARPATSSTPTIASVVNSGPYAKYGHQGFSQNPDPTIPKNESGHPIDHKFTRAIPSSQCIVCHVHPGTNVMNSYLGYTWWDEETDGDCMYPARQKYPTAEEVTQAAMNNPDEASLRGNWSNPEFLSKVSELNPTLKHTQFADFHGHGWIFRAVFKKDRHGTFLDHEGRSLSGVGAEHMMAAVKIPELVKEQYRVQDAPPSQFTSPPTPAVKKPRRCRSIATGVCSYPSARRPSRDGDALRRLPLQARQSRQHEDLSGSPRRDRDPVHRLPRHHLAAAHAENLRSRGP